MKLNEVMTRKPEYITPETTLKDAAVQMRDLDVGMLPVGDGSRLHGVVTDRDMVVRLLADGHDLRGMKAAEAMTPKILYAYEDQSVDEAVHMMREQKVRRLVVVDREKNMTGIVALADLARHAGDASLKAEALEGVSQEP